MVRAPLSTHSQNRTQTVAGRSLAVSKEEAGQDAHNLP